MTTEIRSLVANSASIIDIERTAHESGFRPMRYDGLKKVHGGLTTISEVDRVVASEDF